MEDDLPNQHSAEKESQVKTYHGTQNIKSLFTRSNRLHDLFRSQSGMLRCEIRFGEFRIGRTPRIRRRLVFPVFRCGCADPRCKVGRDGTDRVEESDVWETAVSRWEEHSTHEPFTVDDTSHSWYRVKVNVDSDGEISIGLHQAWILTSDSSGMAQGDEPASLARVDQAGIGKTGCYRL